jgi:hypothetical protein
MQNMEKVVHSIKYKKSMLIVMLIAFIVIILVSFLLSIEFETTKMTAAETIPVVDTSKNDRHDEDKYASEYDKTYANESSLSQKKLEYPQAEENEVEDLVVYDGPIEHIFFHPLIAYPELAFDNDSLSQGYNDWFVTVKEFNRILDSLYQKDFILIDIKSIYEEKVVKGKKVLTKKELLLPINKKPLIISIDDLNYYDYMIENGNVHKLIVDSEGNIATFSATPKGENVIAYDNEIIPIVDEFIKKHNDFSFQGAKGVIALTGYQGVLGYRTDNVDSPAYKSEKNEALKVIERLKETGWSFASHGYGHLDANKVSYNRLVKDTERWKNEVEPLIGPTPIYVYPYGSRVETGDAKYNYLVKSGFNVLCSVGPAPYKKMMPNSIMMDRRHIDGMALRDQRSKLLDLFDSNEVIDKIRP